MSEFIDTPNSPGTNRSAPATDCPTCGGDRFVEVEDADHEVYARCPSCNGGSTVEREPVAEKAWWKE